MVLLCTGHVYLYVILPFLMVRRQLRINRI